MHGEPQRGTARVGTGFEHHCRRAVAAAVEMNGAAADIDHLARSWKLR